jgi:hypothetical protein
MRKFLRPVRPLDLPLENQRRKSGREKTRFQWKFHFVTTHFTTTSCMMGCRRIGVDFVRFDPGKLLSKPMRRASLIRSRTYPLSCPSP